MRNLKRVLSLALALVMVLGMMVITTSAADFTDAEEITYTEAVDVISAIGVINGYPDGTFLPEGTLTREQGAALICYLLMGKDKADKLVGSGLFTDVAADRWSAGEIEYCVNLGYIAGRGDGTFDPEGPLTGIAYGKLLLCALGYDAKVEGYEGENWAAAILSDMVDIGLDVKDVDMGVQLTREQAAQMTLKALQSTMVKYSTKGTTITVGGVEIVNGASEAAAVTTDDDAATIKDDDKVQFAEKYFSNLNKETSGEYGVDVFGRPGYTWVIEADKDIEIFVADKPAFTFTSKVMNLSKTLKGYTANAIVTEDGSVDVDDEGDVVYVTDIADIPTGNGVLVEVYANDEDVITDIVVINEYIGEITKVTPADEDEETKRTVTVGVLEPYETEEFSKKDTVLYTKAGDEIQSMVLAETVEGEVTAKSSKYVKIDGESYKANGTYEGMSSLPVGEEVSVYLDSYGNLLKTGKVADTVASVEDYVLVIDGAVDDWSNKVVKVVYSDGTVEIVDVHDASVDTFFVTDEDTNLTAFNSEKVGGLYTYTVIKGAYKFAAAETEADEETNKTAGYDAYTTGTYSKKDGTINKWAIADDAVFFVYNTEDKEYVVMTGEELLASAGSATVVHAYANKASTGFNSVEFGYVSSELTTKTSVKYGYVVADVEEVKSGNSVVDSVTFWNGTENVTIEAANAETNLKKGDLFSYTLTDGELTDVAKDTKAPTTVKAYDGTYIQFSSKAYEITDDTVIMYIDSDDVEGYEDGEIVLSEEDADGNLIANVIVYVDGEEVTFLLVDVNNEMLVNVEE